MQNDHDLLIGIGKDVEHIIKSMDEMKEERVLFENTTDKRIKGLEKWRAYIVGLAAGVSLGISYAVTKLISSW